jgi:hypothetical protein
MMIYPVYYGTVSLPFNYIWSHSDGKLMMEYELSIFNLVPSLIGFHFVNIF